MAEESTTPVPVEVARRIFDALDSADLDSAVSFYALDAVTDYTRTVGVVVYGRDGLRAFLADWLVGYEDVSYTTEAVIDVGNGVGFVQYLQVARPVGTSGHVTQREAAVAIVEEGLVVATTVYVQSELGEARAAAERLAEEQG